MNIIFISIVCILPSFLGVFASTPTSKGSAYSVDTGRTAWRRQTPSSFSTAPADQLAGVAAPPPSFAVRSKRNHPVQVFCWSGKTIAGSLPNLNLPTHTARTPSSHAGHKHTTEPGASNHSRPEIPQLPGIPQLRLEVESPEGTTREVKGIERLKELEHLRTISELEKQVAEFKRTELALRNRLNGESTTILLNTARLEPPSTSRARRISPRKLHMPKKGFCNQHRNALLIGGIAVLLAAGGGYIVGSRLASESHLPPVSDFSLADFKSCQSSLVSAESSLNATVQDRDFWHQNYLNLYHSLNSSTQAIITALNNCQTDLAQTQNDAELYRSLWQGCQNCNASAAANQTACPDPDELEAQLTLLNNSLALSESALAACQDQLELTQAQLNASQSAFVDCSGEQEACQTALATLNGTAHSCAAAQDACQVALVASDDTASGLRANLTQTQEALNACGTNYNGCQASLANDTAITAQLQTDLTTANNQLAAVQNSLNTCQVNQDACQVALADSNNSAAQLQANLTATQGTLTTCAADKSACQTALASTNATASQLQANVTATQGALTVCSSAKVSCLITLAATNATLRTAFGDEDQMEDEINGLQSNLTATKSALNQTQWNYGQCQANLAQTQSTLGATQAELAAAKPCYNSLWSVVSSLLSALLPSGCPASI